MNEKGYSQRRACALAGIDPRVYRRKAKRPADAYAKVRIPPIVLNNHLSKF